MISRIDTAMTKPEYRNKIHPKKFALWAACASITMMFGAFTSAYIVRQAAGNWLEFRLPDIFFINTAVIILSSVTIELSFRAYRKGKKAMYKNMVALTFLLGIAFVVLQYEAWMTLYDNGIELTGNPSGSFLYVISGMHAAHVLGGLAALLIAALRAWLLDFKVLGSRLLKLDLTRTYWHFVGVLWVYLILFFVLQQS